MFFDGRSMFKPARRAFFALALVAGLAGGFLAPSLAQAQVPYLSLPATDSKYAAIVVDETHAAAWHKVRCCCWLHWF